MKKNIDVLTLSATPIPRTLHMSLSGIRDITLIETPPKTRISVQTFVCEFDEKIIVDACQKELSRNGQVLLVYNRVKQFTILQTILKIFFQTSNWHSSWSDGGEYPGRFSFKTLQWGISDIYCNNFDRKWNRFAKCKHLDCCGCGKLGLFIPLSIERKGWKE